MAANFDEFSDFGQISLNGGQIWPQNIGKCFRKLAVVCFIVLNNAYLAEKRKNLIVQISAPHLCILYRLPLEVAVIKIPLTPQP